MLSRRHCLSGGQSPARGPVGVDQGFVAYVLTSDRSVWRNPLDSFVQIKSVNRDPQFFSPDVERGYALRGLADVDELERVITEQFTNVTDPILDTRWPDSAPDLHSRIIEELGPATQAQPQDHEVFDFAIDMLAEPIDPGLRALVFEVIGLVQTQSVLSLPDGSVEIRVDYLDGVATRETVVVTQDGSLLSREVTLREADTQLGLPAGSVVSSIVYGEWTITESLG